jgi:hypothetical protein
MPSILGNNKNLHISTSYTDIEDPTIDSFFCSNGCNVTVYADYQDVIFDPVFGVNNASTDLSNITINLAQNNITLGNGNNLVYGNYRDLSISIVGGTYNTTGIFNTVLDGVSILQGGNNISVGSGSNIIYGSMRDLSMSAIGGTALGLGTNGVTVNTVIDHTTINLTGGGLGNTITAGNGSKVVYGDLRDFTLTAGGATAISDPTFATSPNTYAITQVQNLNFTVGNNTITLGNGNNTVYGDMATLNLKAPASTSIGFNSNALSGPGDVNTFEANFFFGLGIAPNFNNFNFHGDTISVGNGVNVIYGHLQTLDFSSIGGTASSPGTMPNPGAPYVDSTLPFYEGYLSGANQPVGSHYVNLTMDTTVITAGVGNNTIFGDLQSFQIDLTAGTNTGTFAPPFNGQNSADGVFPFQSDDYSGNALTMAGNIIKVGLSGSGVNTVYGTMQDWTSVANGGLSNQGAAQVSAVSFALFVLGGTGTLDPFTLSSSDAVVTGNNISVGSGTNTIYGDMRDLTFILNGATEDGHNEVSFALPNTGVHDHVNEIDMGYNTVSTLNGVNTIFGSMHDLVWTIHAGQGLNIDPFSTDFAQGNLVSNSVTMGHDKISVGSGVNTIWGDFHNLDLTASGGSNTSAPFSAFSGAIISSNFLFMGSNVITAGLTGSSVNLIYGDGNEINYSVAGGVASSGLIAQDTIRSNVLSMGNNDITTGNGTSTVYGDIHDLVWSAAAGSADGLGSNADAFLRSNTIEMGGNTIHAGSGADIIYGDAQSISLAVTGGIVTNGGILNTYGNNNPTDASAHMINNSITMDGNHLYGGAGNDTIYAHLRDLNFSAIDGTVASGSGNAGALFSGDYKLTNGITVHDSGNHVTFKNDVIDGGAGNDTIIGSDVLNLSGVETFLLPAGSTAQVTWHNNLDGLGNILSVSNDLLGTGLNQITFGDELLTGGLGNDQFVFTLLNGGNKVVANQGAAEVTDFNASGAFDKLVLHTSLISEHTAADLDADHVATFTNAGGNTMITFNSAGSIMLDHVTYTSFVNMGAHLVVMA